MFKKQLEFYNINNDSLEKKTEIFYNFLFRLHYNPEEEKIQKDHYSRFWQWRSDHQEDITDFIITNQDSNNYADLVIQYLFEHPSIIKPFQWRWYNSAKYIFCSAIINYLDSTDTFHQAIENTIENLDSIDPQIIQKHYKQIQSQQIQPFYVFPDEKGIEQIGHIITIDKKPYVIRSEDINHSKIMSLFIKEFLNKLQKKFPDIIRPEANRDDYFIPNDIAF